MAIDLKGLLMEYGCSETDEIQEMKIYNCELSILQVRDKLTILGNILYEDLDNQIYVARIPAGIGDMNYAVMAVKLKGNELALMGYSKEGLIKQNACKKAFHKVEDAVCGKLLRTQSSRKRRLLIVLSLFGIVLCIIIVRDICASKDVETAIENMTEVAIAEDFITVAMEVEETEDTTHLAEVQLMIDVTKAYNAAVKEYNLRVEEYNKAVVLTSVENIGLPSELELLSVESEEFDACEMALDQGIMQEMIAADTETVMDMADQVEQLLTVVKQITAPASEWVFDRLGKVEDIVDVQAVTEKLDPNDMLGEPGGYTGCIYFSANGIDQKSIPGNSVVEKGTDAGGAVEIYATLEDAEARCEYLAGFDGTILYSGSYAIVGTMVIRTSYQLDNTQQVELTTSITNSITSIE